MAKEIFFRNRNITNFRDFGGYELQDGRRVKEDLFFRSGALGYIQREEDRALFASLKINTIFDLRSKKERDRLPDPDLGVRYYAMSAIVDEDGEEIDFSPSHILSFPNLKHLKKKEGYTFLQTYFMYFYERILFHNNAVKAIFDALLNDETPILIHCSAGKDRTGVIAALILLTLGVDAQIVIEDYCATNIYRNALIQQWLNRYRLIIRICPKVKKLIYMSRGVLEETICLCLDMIFKRYASFEEYLNSEYDIDERKRTLLQERYLLPKEVI